MYKQILGLDFSIKQSYISDALYKTVLATLHNFSLLA
jgi:hypothetical protein